jgi:hypothetical protein
MHACCVGLAWALTVLALRTLVTLRARVALAS